MIDASNQQGNPVRQQLLVLRQRIRHAFDDDVPAVFVVTVSVQGLIVIAQFLVAFAIQPEQLGQIRWLESAFAIALLATSCGMPSIVFREAALVTDANDEFPLFLRAALITSSAVALVLIFGATAYVSMDLILATSTWAILIAMSGALWPANVARVGIAIVQGSQRTKAVWRKLLIFSTIGIALLFVSAQLFGVTGWILGRYAVEFGLAAVVIRVLLPIKTGMKFQLGGQPGIQGLVRLGAAANLAFLVRAVCDNLPILLLKSNTGTPAELGWYGFANLTMFLPTLVLSMLMQTRLPGLVQAIQDPVAFKTKLSRIQRELVRGAGLGAGVIAMLSLAVYFGVASPKYVPAAVPLAILAMSLPFRAIILTGGAAAVAHGRYAISSLLAVVEVLVVSVFSLSGRAETAVDMGVAVLLASVLSTLPAVALIRSSRTAKP